MSEFCKFCGTLPGKGEKSCATEEEAFARTVPFPYGCAWFTHEDREPFLAKRWRLEGDGSWYRTDALGYAYRVMKVDDSFWICAWTEKYLHHGLRISAASDQTAEAAMKRMDRLAAEDHLQKVAAVTFAG